MLLDQLRGTAKKRRCLGSADALHEKVGRRHYASKLCLLNRLKSRKIWTKEPLRFHVCRNRRPSKGTLCFWVRKGNSCDEGWVLVKKKERKNVFERDLKVFEPFSSQQLIGAAASSKVTSRSGRTHEQESFQLACCSRLFPSRSGSDRFCWFQRFWCGDGSGSS